MPFQYVAQSYLVVVACLVAAVKAARACESGSSNIAVGPIIYDCNFRSCSSEGPGGILKQPRIT